MEILRTYYYKTRGIQLSLDFRKMKDLRKFNGAARNSFIFDILSRPRLVTCFFLLEFRTYWDSRMLVHSSLEAVSSVTLPLEAEREQVRLSISQPDTPI